MVYEVLNHNNAVCKVADTDIEEAIKSRRTIASVNCTGNGQNAR